MAPCLEFLQGPQRRLLWGSPAAAACLLGAHNLCQTGFQHAVHSNSRTHVKHGDSSIHVP
jgi:hypothetical protein